jgi:putative addiction module killer protein
MRITKFKKIYLYQTKSNRAPFAEWLESLADKSTRYRIKERLDRIALGNLGDYKAIGAGVFELKMSFGSGYRIYFSQEQSSVIILLCGGDKSTQSKDIKNAITYWRDYLARNKNGK